jgi:hypothetical protein
MKIRIKCFFSIATVCIALCFGCRSAKISATEKALIPVSNPEIRQLQHDLLTYKYVYSNIWPYNLDELLDFQRKRGNHEVTYDNFESLGWKQDNDSLKVDYTYSYPDQSPLGFDTVKGGITLYTTSDSTAYISHDLYKVRKRKTAK